MRAPVDTACLLGLRFAQRQADEVGEAFLLLKLRQIEQCRKLVGDIVDPFRHSLPPCCGQSVRARDDLRNAYQRLQGVSILNCCRWRLTIRCCEPLDKGADLTSDAFLR